MKKRVSLIWLIVILFQTSIYAQNTDSLIRAFQKSITKNLHYPETL